MQGEGRLRGHECMWPLQQHQQAQRHYLAWHAYYDTMLCSGSIWIWIWPGVVCLNLCYEDPTVADL